MAEYYVESVSTKKLGVTGHSFSLSKVGFLMVHFLRPNDPLSCKTTTTPLYFIEWASCFTHSMQHTHTALVSTHVEVPVIIFTRGFSSEQNDNFLLQAFFSHSIYKNPQVQDVAVVGYQDDWLANALKPRYIKPTETCSLQDSNSLAMHC